LAVDARSGRLWACFYRTGRGPARRSATFSCATSRDGVRWGVPVAVASSASNETVPNAFKGFVGREFGDYEGIAVAGGVAHPIWTDSRRLATSGEEIYTTTLTPR